MIYGVAINDANYIVQPVVNGKQVKCPYYSRWYDMIRRCYSKTHNRADVYSDCTVICDWLRFTNFKEWMLTQEWQGLYLDKDIRVIGNKEYGPNTCLFVEASVNSFLTGSNRGDDKGVTRNNNKFQARCSNPSGSKWEYLGTFETEESARVAYLKRKSEITTDLINKTNCPILKSSLLNWKNKFEMEVLCLR